MPDGVLIEASVQKPAGFDATKKYPVWVKTYGGPSMPQVRGQDMADQAAANTQHGTGRTSSLQDPAEVRL